MLITAYPKNYKPEPKKELFQSPLEDTIKNIEMVSISKTLSSLKSSQKQFNHQNKNPFRVVECTAFSSVDFISQMEQMAKNYSKDEEEMYVDRGEEECSSEIISSNLFIKNKSQAILIENQNDSFQSNESFSHEEDVEEQ